MSIFAKVKNFFKQIFCKNIQTENTNVQDLVLPDEQIDIDQEFEKFKMHNIILEKLERLEQYIKIFSLNFPQKYTHYLSLIKTQKKDYEQELEKYKGGLMGQIAFAIDPECESARLITVSNLEREIKDFVELDVNFAIYKEKFSKLCLKLNQFYNALLDTKKDTTAISAQLNKAISSMEKLIYESRGMRFFVSDTRKKETILNYIIYGEYIFLKSCLRCSSVKDFDDYRNNVSKFHNLFISTTYDNLIFKFFIADLEKYQTYITDNLKDNKMYNHILKSCQALQTRLNRYQDIFHDSTFFNELLNFENTIDTISETNGNEYVISMPENLETCVSNNSEKNPSVNDTAVAVLSMLETNKAKILCKIIANFSYEISWREFFFLCKIFELYDDVKKNSSNTIFKSVYQKFVEFDSKYKQYSSTFIKEHKKKLLNYKGSKTKKYILLLSAESLVLPTILYELKQLNLDFIVSTNKVYLNHSYFNGFKNLEKNFGNYILSEEII